MRKIDHSDDADNIMSQYVIKSLYLTICMKIYTTNIQIKTDTHIEK